MKKNENQFFKKEWLQLSVLLILIVLISILFFRIIKIFLIPLILSITLTILFYPLFKKWKKLLKNKNSLSSITFCFILILLFLVPLYFIAHLVTLQAIDFYDITEDLIKQTIKDGDNGLIGNIKNNKIIQWLSINNIDIQNLLNDTVKSLSKFFTFIINTVSTSILETFATTFLTFYSLFYFLRDGDKLLKKIIHLSPLKDEYEKKIILRLGAISKATINGTVVVGVIQGVAGMLTFIIFGIKGWILWGVVMIILSIIPVVGSFLIMIPAAIIKISTGHIWQGIIIIFVAIILNYAIDYLLRPILVGKESKMHDLLIFISTLGGISIFGVTGFIIGPMIAMFFVTLLDIYGEEFKDLLQ